MEKTSRVYVAGHTGLVGSALVRWLRRAGHTNLLLRDRGHLDLRDPRAVSDFFRLERPEFVFLAAAKVGGILANDSYPADFIRDNLLIQINVIEACREIGVRKLLFLGSSCIYPKFARQPISEDELLDGPLEVTNEAYAIAKIAGIKMVQAYQRQHGLKAVCLIPTNLYGPGDNFDLETAHVIPALLRKFHDAKIRGLVDLVVWGTGTPRREFMHVDDLADAAGFLMRNSQAVDVINVGTGEELSIAELCLLIADIVGYAGKIRYDSSKPDGTPRKLLNGSRLRDLGWAAQIDLQRGIRQLYAWYLERR